MFPVYYVRKLGNGEQYELWKFEILQTSDSEPFAAKGRKEPRAALLLQ
jgi:hypothetical protein